MLIELWTNNQWTPTTLADARLIGANSIGKGRVASYIITADGGVISPAFWREVGSNKPHPRGVGKKSRNIYRTLNSPIVNAHRDAQLNRDWLAGPFKTFELPMAERMAEGMKGKVVKRKYKYYIIKRETP